MPDGPEVTIPPDFIKHETGLYSTFSVPWSIPPSIFGGLKTTGAGVKVCVIDTGFEPHVDVKEPVEYVDLHGEGKRLRNDHGLHVAGTILGDNGIGVAPGATLYVIKVLGGQGGSGSSDRIAAAYRLARSWKVDVINASLGSSQPYAPTQREIELCEQEGILCAVAAGNSGFSGRGSSIGYPGRYAAAMCVGATRPPYKNQTIAAFSSGGPEIDIAAPGERVLSSTAGNSRSEYSGTSMACPYVAGIACHIREALRLLGLPRPKNRAEWGMWFNRLAFDAGQPGFDPYFGHGIVMAENVVEKLSTPENWRV